MSFRTHSQSDDAQELIVIIISFVAYIYISWADAQHAGGSSNWGGAGSVGYAVRFQSALCRGLCSRAECRVRGRALRADPLVTRPQRQIDFRRTVTVVAPTLAGRVLHADPAEAGRIENICGGPSCRRQTAPRRQVERCTPTQDERVARPVEPVAECSSESAGKWPLKTKDGFSLRLKQKRMACRTS